MSDMDDGCIFCFLYHEQLEVKWKINILIIGEDASSFMVELEEDNDVPTP